MAPGKQKKMMHGAPLALDAAPEVDSASHYGVDSATQCGVGSLEPTNPRIAALVIPHFLIEVCLRRNPSLAGRPLAIADGISRREIVAANNIALGVHIGMTPKQARAACPGLAIVARDEKAERAATNELLDLLSSCSPVVEALCPGVYFFDAQGLPDGETKAIASAMALAATLGFHGAAAVADDKFSAHCAALTGGGCSIVPPGGSAAFLAPLPISLLPLAPGDKERFEVLGLRLLGQIAALPTAPLAARFGERAREYANLARGESREPLQPRRAQIIYEERFEFESPVDRLEPLFFTLRGCIAGVAGRLAGAAQACDRLDITLVIDHLYGGCRGRMYSTDSTVDVQVPLAEPTASSTIMFDLARVALESREQVGLVEAIIVRAAPCGEPPPQLGLFDGSRGSRAAALAATLARLRATLAADEVVTLQTQRERSRLPEHMQCAVPVSSPRQFTQRLVQRSPRAVRSNAFDRSNHSMPVAAWAPALRLLDPPRPIPVPEKRPKAGPFRLSESWWEQPIERDYYQLIDRNGSLVLAFVDLRSGGWYMHGIFD